MTVKKFSRTWNSSTQPRKQRKYRSNAPLHVKQKLLHTHLSKELRGKYSKRSIQLKTGDKVKVQRGQHKGKEGKVERINLKRERVYVTGVEYVKKDGLKQLVALNASNLTITSLVLDDKKRKAKLEGKKQDQKKESKTRFEKKSKFKN
jgi:large subunit ribosomal protein L24